MIFSFVLALAELALLGLPVGTLAFPADLPVLTKRDPKHLTNKTQPYAVDGANLPDINFDIGESYAGLMPVGDEAGRELFFWFVPSENPEADNEILIWLNGGPGCSSMIGFLQENGPISWQTGTYVASPNIYSWTNLTNVIWVEQPAGTAFSGYAAPGNNTDEVTVAAQFLGFWKNFIDTFDMQGRKVAISGESYAGNYVPYIAEAMLNTTGEDFGSYYNVSGILIYDPILGDREVSTNAAMVDYVLANKNFFPFSDEKYEEYYNLSTECGFEDMMEQANTFPPTGYIQVPEIVDANMTDSSITSIGNPDCQLQQTVMQDIMELNPCFNIYYIGDTCPHKGNILGDPYVPQAIGSPEVWFTRKDVQEAIHAPVGFEWSICSNRTGVFFDGHDRSKPSATNGGPLMTVIERTNNVIVGHGTLDMVLMVNGSLMALQNLTWNGAQGFSEPLNKELFVPYHPQGFLPQSGNGTFGHWTEDRGLIFSTVELAGHEVPGYQPGAGYRHLEKLLGRISSLDEQSNFTTTKYAFPA